MDADHLGFRRQRGPEPVLAGRARERNDRAPDHGLGSADGRLRLRHPAGRLLLLRRHVASGMRRDGHRRLRRPDRKHADDRRRRDLLGRLDGRAHGRTPVRSRRGRDRQRRPCANLRVRRGARRLERADHRRRRTEPSKRRPVPALRRDQQDALAELASGRLVHARRDGRRSALGHLVRHLPRPARHEQQPRHGLRQLHVECHLRLRRNRHPADRTGHEVDQRRERRHRPVSRHVERHTDGRRRRNRARDEPAVPAEQRLLRQLELERRLGRLHRRARKRHLRHRRRSRLERRRGQRQALDQGQHDRPLLRRWRLHAGLADLPHRDPLRLELELRARPEQAHLAARLHSRALRARQRGQRRAAPDDSLHVRQRRRRTGDGAHAHRRDQRLSVPGQRQRLQRLLPHDRGQWRLHAPRGVDRPQRGRHRHLPEPFGHCRLRRIGRHVDEQRQCRSLHDGLLRLQLHERCHDAAGPEGRDVGRPTR